MNEPVPQGVALYLRRHWWHLLLAVPGALLITIVHEAAHAVAVLLQGGHVTEFVWWPSRREWGHTQFTFPVGAAYSGLLISIAPYLVWMGVSLATAVSVHWRRPKTYGGASLVFVWLYCAPVLDIANTALPYLTGKSNDFFHAFGNPGALVTVGLVAFASICALGGYFVQWLLYRDQRLSPLAYLVLSVSLGVGVYSLAL